MDQRLALLAACVAGGGRKLLKNLLRHLFRITANADRHLLGQADPVGIDVDLDDRRILRPIVYAIAGQCRERIEPRTQCQHDICLADQFHRRLRAVVAQGPDRQPMASGKGVVVLIAAAHRRIQLLRQCHGFLDGVADDDTGAVENDRELRFRKQPRGLGDGRRSAGRPLEADDARQVHVDHLSPEVPRDVDLRRCATAPCLLDDPVEDFGNAARIAHFLLVADHLLEHRHLVDFLEAALADGLVGRLRRDHEQRRMVPVGRLHRRDETGHTGAVLADRHRHCAGRPAEAVGHHAGIGLVGTVPEPDARLRKQVRYGHHRRADDPERMLDAVHLQDFYKRLFGRHFHVMFLSR